MSVELQKEKLLSLFVDLHTLTNLRLALFDANFREVVSYPEEPCRFCALVRSRPLARARCDASDRHAFRVCGQSKRFYSYRCHAGLIETAAPILDGDIIIGYIMFGQITDLKNPALLWEQIRTRCRDYGIPEEDLYTAFKKIAVFDEEKIKAASQILQACAGYIRLAEMAYFRKDDLIRRFRDFTENRYAEKLTAGDIAKALGVSRTKLYEAVRQYAGIGVSEYLNRLRVEKAKDLLLRSDLSVTGAAARVGFDDYNYFIKVFRRRTGLTPTAFRKSRDFTEPPA